MITKELARYGVAYQKGYEDARRHEIVAVIQSLHDRAQILSKSLPELAEGIRIAAEIVEETFEARNPRSRKVKN